MIYFRRIFALVLFLPLALTSCVPTAGAGGPEPMLQRATAMLDSEAPYNRRDAATQLGRLGPEAEPAVPALIETLRQDPEDFVREEAARALGQIGDAAAVDPLTDAAVDDQAETVRSAAQESLTALGADVTPILARSLESDDAETRWAAARSLAERRDRRGIDAVARTMANSDDDDRRWQAARLLGTLGADAAPAVPALTDALRSDHQRVRAEAARALGEIGPVTPAVVPALIEALPDATFERSVIMGALAEIGPEAAPAVPVLLPFLEPTPDLEGDAAIHAWRARHDAIGALTGIGPAAADAIPALIGVLAQETPFGAMDDVKGAAVDALVAIGPAAVEPLTAALEHQDQAVRTYAGRALERIR